MNLITNFWGLFLESAPWLLLGLLVAGLIKQWIPLSWMQRQLGGNGVIPTIKAAVLGAPLPLCSCSVIPAALGLRRAGASKSATTAFMVATPETGVDSISVSYALLGPFMAVIRPLAAISSAITAGLLVGHQPEKVAPAAASQSCSGSSCCCSSASTGAQTAVQTSSQSSKQSSSCGSDTEASDKGSGFIRQMGTAVSYAAGPLLRDTTGWLLIGLFFAALVQSYVPVDFLARWGQGLIGMTLMVLVSIPMYICATASTPVAAGLLLSGISPGAVLVFMLAGPATNIATLGVVKKELGTRAIWAYLTGVIGCALLFGALTDLLIAQFGFTVAPLAAGHHEESAGLLTIGSGILLAGLMARVLWQQYAPLLKGRRNGKGQMLTG